MTTTHRIARLSILSYVTIIAPFVHASPDPDCGPGATPSLGTLAMGEGKAGDGTIYVDDRGATGNGVWIYQECNTQDWLQRGGGSSPIVPDDNEMCNDDGVIVPDCMLL